jgi:hypothetical protein
LWLVLLTICFLREEEKIVNKQIVIILTTIECRKEEKTVRKQIVSNTNYNRMPERREKFFTILSSFRHSIVVSITDYLFSYSFLFFPAFYCC